MDGIHLEDCEFEITAYVYTNKAVTYRKGDAKNLQQIDEDSYKVIVYSDDSVKIGKGKVLARLVIHIPDMDYEDGFRTEIYDGLWTGITI